jgi:hypothetical protein
MAQSGSAGISNCMMALESFAIGYLNIGEIE